MHTLQVLQEPETWMTSMDSPTFCLGHVVVISWFLIGAPVFGMENWEYVVPCSERRYWSASFYSLLETYIVCWHWTP